MSADPKAGQKGVLVTRPAHQAEPFCELIEQAGFQAIRFPVIGIEAISPSQPSLAFSDYHSVIFISVNAVTYSLPHLDVSQLQQKKVAAIGKKTAQALLSVGISVALSPEDNYDSESLLVLWQSKKGENILIIRGVGGREYLANTLRKRAARVDYFEVYRRTCPQHSIEPILQQKHRWHCTTATSNQTIDHLLQLFNEEAQSELLKRPLIVISLRMLQYAENKGFLHVYLASRVSNEAILDTLKLC